MPGASVPAPLASSAFRDLRRLLAGTALLIIPVLAGTGGEALAQQGAGPPAAEPFELRLRGSAPESADAPDPPPTRARTRSETRAGTRDTVREPVSVLPTPIDADPAGEPPLADEPEADPFEPQGLRLGAMRLFTDIAQSLGYDSNPARTRNAGPGDVFSRTQGEARLESDWSRHELSLDLRGGFDAYRGASSNDSPSGEANAALRLDVTGDTSATLGMRGNLDTERPGGNDIADTIVNRTPVIDYSGSIALDHDPGRLRLGLRGTVGRTEHASGRGADGGRISQRERDLTRYEIAARVGYEISPGLIPFTEIALDRRRYDRALADGTRRSSTGLTGLVGARFELTRLLTGEISGGYQQRRYDTAGRRELTGFVGDAALEWALTPITLVRLSGFSRLDETTRAGARARRVHGIGLDFEHALRHRLTGRASFAHEIENAGAGGPTERTNRAGVGLDYTLNRHGIITLDYRWENQRSTEIGGGYDANLYLLGMRLRY
ncbi:MAG: outer membrane beta-barrel protein [Salinarimonas sp.]|nr:outer membrane beta-barrel protein [Salinarimonas sp.]